MLDAGQTLKDVYDIRTPLYEKYADIIVDSDNGTDIQEIALKIVEQFEG